MDYSASRKHLLQHRLFPFQWRAHTPTHTESPCRYLGGGGLKSTGKRPVGLPPPFSLSVSLPPFQDRPRPQARRRASLPAKWQRDSAANLQTESANYTSQPSPLPGCRAVHAGISIPPGSPKDECVSWLNPSSAQLAPSALRVRGRKAEHASPPHSRPHSRALPPGRLRERMPVMIPRWAAKAGCEAAPSPAEAQRALGSICSARGNPAV